MCNGNGKLNGDKRKKQDETERETEKASLKVFFDETKKGRWKDHSFVCSSFEPFRT